MPDENEDFLENQFTEDDSSADENSGLFEHLNIKVDKNQ